jgi:hypothetical protein
VCTRVLDFNIFIFYFRCSGTVERLLTYKDLLFEMWSWRENCIVASDFNIDLGIIGNLSSFVSSFLCDRALQYCYNVRPGQILISYLNNALGHESLLEFFFTNAICFECCVRDQFL